MTPEDAERLARSRFQTIQLCRFTGFIMMILGLWIGFGDIVQEGGWRVPGMLIFLAGLFEALWLPVILARRWKSPPE